MKAKSVSWWTVVIFAVGLISLSFSVYGEGKFSGYMFGDFYYNLTNNNPELEGENGFWFRRIYFTYDYKISDSWTTRLRLEMNSPGDFKSSDFLKPYIKDAYLAYKIGNHTITNTIILGISPTPTWEYYIVDFWGYRAVEKTPLDLYKMGESRDFGIAFKGSIGKDGFFGYHVMAGNGEGIKSEFNKEKKYMGAFLFILQLNFSLELYADYGLKANKYNTYFAYYTYQAFLGWKHKKGRLGVQYSHRFEEQEVEKGNFKFDVYSIFGIINVSEKLSLLARYDRMNDPLPWGSTVSYVPFNETSPFNLILFGVDFHPLNNVSVIPNLMYVVYDDVDEKDTQLKLTFFYSF